MNRDDLIDHWKDAINNGTFLTNKHDPASLGTSHPGYRTVTVMSAPEIKTFIETGDYTIRQFRNNDPKHTDEYYEIVPLDTSMVAGSGVQPLSPVPTTACDRFVAVSGEQQGWHLFAEESSQIAAKESSGDLTFQIELL